MPDPAGFRDQALRLTHAVHPLVKKGLRALRRVYRGIARPDSPFGMSDAWVERRGQAASDLLRERLLEGKPLLVARFGMVELDCVVNYLLMTRPVPLCRKVLDYATWSPYLADFEPGVRRHMSNNAGFFPTTDQALARFCRLMLADAQGIDLLGSWLRHERFLGDRLAGATRVHLEDLPPYRHASPWSAALAGKRVLVVHPFEESIRRQYQKRELLFEDPRVLPAFELLTVKAVQSIAGTDSGFGDWFLALDHMKARMDALRYDVALIGCGAYGLPLAAHAKRSGRMAVHLGGALQNLFGIIGKRWETEYGYGATRYNPHWARPLESERPANAGAVEGGCYW
jgi:hypothetical protein